MGRGLSLRLDHRENGSNVSPLPQLEGCGYNSFFFRIEIAPGISKSIPLKKCWAIFMPSRDQKPGLEEKLGKL